MKPRPPTRAHPHDPTKKPKIKLRQVTDDWRLVVSRAASPSPLGHLSRHLTLQTLALLASLTGTRAGVIHILDSLSPHCDLISTNALDLNQACDLVQRQFLGCLAAFVTTCAAAHGPSNNHEEPVTVDRMLRILADARYDSRHDDTSSAESSAWDTVVEQGERIVSEWVSTPANANPRDVVTDEEKHRRREMFDELAEQLSDLMTREYPRLWRHLNDHVDEISIQVAVRVPVVTASSAAAAGSRKPSSVGFGNGAQQAFHSASTETSPTLSDASSSTLPLSEKYSTFQLRPPPTTPASASTTNPDAPTTSRPTPTPTPKPSSPQPLTAHQRQSTLARIRTEYASTTTASPTARRSASSSSASSSSNTAPFRVHVDRHFPTSAQSLVLTTSQSADSHAYQSYASTHVRRAPYVSHPTPWLPPTFSSSSLPSPSPPHSSSRPAPPTATPASSKYGGSWSIPPHLRARAMRERAREAETGVSMGYRLTPSGGERNAQVRGKVDELARHVAGVSVEMAAEARALHGGGGEGVGGKGKGKRA